jgi:hypothetical protein
MKALSRWYRQNAADDKGKSRGARARKAGVNFRWVLDVQMQGSVSESANRRDIFLINFQSWETACLL